MKDKQEPRPNKQLRRERELRGWSQRAVAASIGTTEQVVTRWESGQHKPNRHFQTQLCQLFGKSAEELGFMNKALTASVETDANKENSSERLPSSLPNQHKEAQEILLMPLWERLSRVLERSSHIDETMINVLEQITKDYWKLRATIGYQNLLHGLSGHLETVIDLLQRSQLPAFRKRLCSLASEIAQCIGAIYFDMNNYIIAQKYYYVSIDAAREAENAVLRAIGLIRMSSLPIYSNRSHESLPFLQRAKGLIEAGNTPTILAWIACMEAEAYAHLHDERACFQALRQAEYVVAQLESKEGPYETQFDYARFIGYKGVCYLHLQQPEAALAAIHEGIKLQSTLSLRQQSIIVADSAAAYSQQGEIEEACKLAIQALTMTDQTRSSLVIHRLLGVRRDMLQWKSFQPVKEFDHQLALRGVLLS